jgi:hypothetical protein
LAGREKVKGFLQRGRPTDNSRRMSVTFPHPNRIYQMETKDEELMQMYVGGDLSVFQELF